jgi:hypothetical protein
MRLVLDVDHRALGQPPHAAEQQLGVALDEGRTAGQVGVEALADPVVQRQHPVPGRLDQPEALELVELVGVLLGEVAGLGPVSGGVVQLPDVVEGVSVALVMLAITLLTNNTLQNLLEPVAFGRTLRTVGLLRDAGMFAQ